MLTTHRTTILTTSLILLPILGGLGCPKEAEVPECGDVRESQGSGSSNIVNGDLAWDPTVVPLTEGQALAVAAVMTPDGFGGWTSVCTATVVAPTLALMAAHCVTDRRGRTSPPSNFALAIGDDNAQPLALLTPDRVEGDPWYNPRSTGAAHDQALFIFDTPVTDAVPELTPIPFNRKITDPAVALGEDIQTVGFGCIDSNCNLYNNLKYWAVEELVEITTFDLTVDGHGVAGVCFGDSGGPVLRNVPGEGVKVLGTLSYGDPDCGNRDHYCITEGEAHFLDVYAPGCGEVTVEGSCDGSTATYCEDDLPITLDCAASGEVCQNDGSGLFRCVDPCAGETLVGRCDGDDAIWCENGTVKVRRCADCGLSCGLSDTLGTTGCL